MTVHVPLWVFVAAFVWIVFGITAANVRGDDYGVVTTLMGLFAIIGTLVVLLIHAWGWL